MVEHSLPTPKCHMLPLYCRCIFSPNHLMAKSGFWYFVSQLKKMKNHPAKSSTAVKQLHVSVRETQAGGGYILGAP